MSDLRRRLAEAIRAEAAQYPGDDGERCGDHELDCMDLHVHEFITTGGSIRVVAGTPERHAALALSVFAEWLRERANEHHTRGNWDSERHIDELADEIDPQP